MKKAIWVLTVACFVVGCIGLVLAATPAQQKATADIMRAQAIEKARALLMSREWTIYLTPAGSGRVSESDVLTFTEGTVTSKKLLAMGYQESNYTLRFEDEMGIAVWVTMQTNPGVGLAFLRGEIYGSTFKGVITIAPKKGAKTVYSYTTEIATTAPKVVPTTTTKKK